MMVEGASSRPQEDIVVSQKGLGFRVFFGGRFNKDYSILAAILGSPYCFGKLPYL